MLTINNTLDGYLKDVEILGNTIQDEEDLADIRSVGEKVEGQELYEIPVLSVGGNLFNINSEYEDNLFYFYSTGNKVNDTSRRSYIVPIKEGMSVKYINSKDIHVTYYTKDGIYISGEVSGDSRVRVIPKGTYFAKFGVRKDVGYEYDKLCVCESSFTNDYYEPYIEDKITILSPVQLEKVGDVADRIICKDGVWGVEKNVGTVVLNGSENWNAGSSTDLCIRFTFVTMNNIKYGKIIATIPTYMDDISFSPNLVTFGICSRNNNTGFNFHIEKEKLSSQDVGGFKKWLSENNILVKYQLATPTFIPLPHSQQIKLRTFANKTNISFLTEVEGTIKAQVPKSLGATVSTHTTQIDNLFDLVMGIISNVHIEEDETSIVGNTLNLTTDKYQVTNMVNNTQIVLPTVDKFTEIHLFFDATSDMTLVYPEVKWQTVPTIKANASYEFIFTYVNDAWLGGFIVRK